MAELAVRKRRLEEAGEQPAAAVVALGDMLERSMTGEQIGADGNIGLLFAVSAAGLVAICGIIVAWLKWRHPPQNK